MANPTVSVSAVPFNPQTQTFGSTSNMNMGTVNLNSPAPVQQPKTDLKAFNQQMVAGNKTPTITPSNIPNQQNISTFNTPKIELPQQQQSNTPQQTSNYAATLAQQYQVEDTANQKLAQNLGSSIYDLLPKLAGQQQELDTQQKAQNLPQLKQNLTDLSNQITKKQAELNQDDIRLAAGLNNIEKQAIPMQFITGQQQSVARDAQIARALKSSEIGVLNAQALAAQGNIALAKETAQEAVDLKFAPYKEAIQIYQQQLEALQPILSSDEKKQAAQQTLMSNIALRQIDVQIGNQKDVQKLAMNAAAQGASQDLITRASQAKTPVEAASILGQYAGDYWKIEEYKKAAREYKIADGDFVGAASDIIASAQDIARAISGQETNYGQNVRPGASGELASKYQYLPSTWDRYSKEYNAAVNKNNKPLAFSRDVEDAVTEWKIQQWINQGFSPVQIAAMWNGGEGAANDWKSRVGVNKQGVKYSVPDYVKGFSQKLLGATDTTTSLNLNKTQLAQYNDIINEVNAQTKTDMETIKFANSIQGTGEQAKAGNRQAQVAVIFNFMKALDPTSTVRESEFSLIQNAQSLPQSFQQAVIKWGTGERLDPLMVDEMIAVATDRANSSKSNINQVIKDAETRAAQFKIPTGSIKKLYENRLNNSSTSLEDEAISIYEKAGNTNQLNYSLFEQMVKTQ